MFKFLFGVYVGFCLRSYENIVSAIISLFNPSTK